MWTLLFFLVTNTYAGGDELRIVPVSNFGSEVLCREAGDRMLSEVNHPRYNSTAAKQRPRYLCVKQS